MPELEHKVGWRPRFVKWIADLLGVTTYPAPYAIVIYDLSGEAAAYYRNQRAEDEAIH